MKTLITSAILLAISLSFVSLERFSALDDPFRVFDKNHTNNTNSSCVNCHHLATSLPNGTVNVEKCPDNTTCNLDRCSSEPNPLCSTNMTADDFICRTPGIYPDPFDCKTYHYCVPERTTFPNGTHNGTTLTKHTTSCDGCYGYNPETSSCDIILEDSKCQYWELLTCIKYGQSEVIWRNPRLYYICLHHPRTGELYPFVYTCEHGKEYNSFEHLCKD